MEVCKDLVTDQQLTEKYNNAARAGMIGAYDEAGLPISLLEFRLTPTERSSKMMQIQALILTVLIASGAAHKPGRAPQGDLAFRLQGKRRNRK